VAGQCAGRGCALIRQLANGNGHGVVKKWELLDGKGGIRNQKPITAVQTYCVLLLHCSALLSCDKLDCYLEHHSVCLNLVLVACMLHIIRAVF